MDSYRRGIAAQRNRLSQGGRINRNKPLRFTFDGRCLTGYEGDTLAAALLANGVRIVGRSFKYARPRGVLGAGVEEPNAIVQLGATEATQTPNVRATEQPLFDGLVCRSVNGWPSVEHDAMSTVGALAGDIMAPGFYYKTFLKPAWIWRLVEPFIRRAAGLGRSARLPDPDTYDHLHHHTDVLIVGAGPAGLAAGLAAAATGARVLLADEQPEPGGTLLSSHASIDGQSASDWISNAVTQLDAAENVVRLSQCTVTGFHDHRFLTLWERCSDACGDRAPLNRPRHRLHKVRAGAVVLASGAHERPLVFANNDLPGCMLASAVSTYITRYAVVPGQHLVLMTTNDAAYQAAFDWADAGREVVAIVDTRAAPAGSVTAQARQRGLTVIYGAAIIEAVGHKQVEGAWLAPIDSSGKQIAGEPVLLDCDTVASSGGFSPAVHLSCHTGTRPVWRDDVIGFVPGALDDRFVSAGAVAGTFTLGGCLASGQHAGASSVSLVAQAEQGIDTPASPLTVHATSEDDLRVAAPMAMFLVPHTRPPSRAPKQFVDFQNDVTAAGLQMSVREGFESIEHVKRYTAMGFGTDQGKTGNINGMAIVAAARGLSIPETGTTVFRPNYTPTTFGAVAGAHVGDLFDPKRFTPMHAWHLEHGAAFEVVGQWMRPYYYPQGQESMQDAVNRECLAVREGVGVLDASTLGKIDIQGPDAREFLERVYTNAWRKLAPGRCRYGLMCGEDGMVMDDGVTACLDDNHFHMTTTTGGAAAVLSWLELYQQTEWPELQVYFNSVTDHWATASIAGPHSRALLALLCSDIDLDNFSFMDWRSGHVAGVPARVFRISFTGELSYEINVPAQYGAHLWNVLFEHGSQFDLTPYGTEAMHVLRAEKGFIIVGQDTDGSMTPIDLDHGWCVANQKPFSFIGKRGMARADCLRSDRKQLVGLRCHDTATVIPEGSQAVFDPHQAIPMTMVGHVTSSYYSACLGRSIAMGVIKGGLSRMGETVWFPQATERPLAATICSPVWLDPEGQKQKVEVLR